MKLINLANTAQQFPRDAPLNCFPSASDYENSRRLCFFVPTYPPGGLVVDFRCGLNKNETRKQRKTRVVNDAVRFLRLTDRKKAKNL